jgi:hypothetical protein
MTDGVIVEKIPVNRFFRKRVKFWFGMYVWQSITQERDLDWSELGKVFGEEFIVDAFFYAQEYGAVKDHRRILSKDVIQKACDLMPQKQMNRIVQCMAESMTGGETIMKSKGDKKK